MITPGGLGDMSVESPTNTFGDFLEAVEFSSEEGLSKKWFAIVGKTFLEAAKSGSFDVDELRQQLDELQE